jgi:hypothetical protein
MVAQLKIVKMTKREVSVDSINIPLNDLGKMAGNSK